MSAQLPSDEWDAEEALASLVSGPELDGETEEQMAQRIFKEHGPGAALSIVQLSMRSRNERIRLDASKYVIERVLGPASNPHTDGREKAPLETFLAEMVEQAENHANTGEALVPSPHSDTSSSVDDASSGAQQEHGSPPAESRYELGSDGLPDLPRE